MKVAKLATLMALIAAGPVILSAPAQAAPPPLGSEPVTLSASPMFTALSQYLNLPVEQARTRWHQEQRAAKTDAQLKRRLGNTHLGSWLTDDGQLNVVISDPAKAALVRSTGAHPQLNASKGKALRDAVKLLSTAKRPDGFVSWHPDPTANHVVVNVTPGTETTARTWLKKRLGATPFAVRTTADILRPSAIIRGGGSISVPNNPYWPTNLDYCSIGFAVEGGFITAGHCGRVGHSVQTDTGFTGDPIGTFEASVYGIDGDFAFVETRSTGATLMAEVTMYDGDKTVHVDGSDEAPIGATVCRSGRATGWRCGTILAKDVEVEDPNGSPVGGLTLTNACQAHGDSGGPFIADGQAQGTLWGGSAIGCDGRAESFFQPINEVLTKLNLKLLTESEEPPWTPDPGFACC